MRQRHKNLSFVSRATAAEVSGFTPPKLFIGDKIMKIWLDDIRPAPDGFTLAHSVNEAIALIEKAEMDGAGIDLIDCDHDLGDYFPDGGDGIKLLDWLCERQTFYPIALHTANPVGRNNMLRLIRRHWR